MLILALSSVVKYDRQSEVKSVREGEYNNEYSSLAAVQNALN